MDEIQKVDAPLRFDSGQIFQKQGNRDYVVDFHGVLAPLVHNGVQIYICSHHVVICYNERFMVLTEENSPTPFQANYWYDLNGWEDYSLFDQWLKIGKGCVFSVQEQFQNPIHLPIEDRFSFGKLLYKWSRKQGTVYDSEHHMVVVKEKQQKYMVLPKDKEDPKPFRADDLDSSDCKQFGVWISYKGMNWITDGSLCLVSDH